MKYILLLSTAGRATWFKLSGKEMGNRYQESLKISCSVDLKVFPQKYYEGIIKSFDKILVLIDFLL